ncbi:MAG: hypothetical protein ACD_21C00209G0008, partial [uncultured bacterium]
MLTNILNTGLKTTVFVAYFLLV